MGPNISTVDQSDPEDRRIPPHTPPGGFRIEYDLSRGLITFFPVLTEDDGFKGFQFVTGCVPVWPIVSW